VAPFVQRHKVWLPCSNAAKTRNPLKLQGCPKLANRSQPLVDRSSPYYQDVEEVLLFNKFSIVYTCLSSEDIARQSCAMVPKWRFFCVQHISALHSKFALGPHHVSKYGRHPICGRRDQARKKKKKKHTTGQKYNIGRP